MAIDKEQLGNDLDCMIADDPHDLVIGSAAAIPCSKSKLSREQQYSEYGYGDNYKLSVTARKALVSAIPGKGDTVKVDNVDYQVLNDESDSADIALFLHLGDAIT